MTEAARKKDVGVHSTDTEKHSQIDFRPQALSDSPQLKGKMTAVANAKKLTSKFVCVTEQIRE